MNRNCRGHTLIELFIAMSLSVIIIGALVPINNLGLRAADHQQKIILGVNQLRQSFKQFEIDIKSSGAKGCLFNRNNIRDRLFRQPISNENQLEHPWLAANHSGIWNPTTPYFDNSNISSDHDAIHLMLADLAESLNSNSLTVNPNRAFYLTNCAVAEIARGNNATLHNVPNSKIYPLQSIVYYIRDIDNETVLYRQYLNKSGNTRNEPLIDNIKALSIAYAEKISTEALVFKKASNVSDWNQVIAIYLHIEIKIQSLPFSISKLIALPNLNA